MGDNQQFEGFAPLANVARLTRLIDQCQSRAHGLPGMGCFYGPAGRGKTTAGIYAVNAKAVCHVTALPFGGVKKLLEMIATELALRPARTVAGLFDQVAQALAVSNRPLLLDEADHLLTDRMIETVRMLHDNTGAPVILMGEELLPQKLTKWERVHGRMLAWVGAEPATAEDLKLLSRVYAPGITVGAPLRAAVLAASRGSMRLLSTNLARLAEFAAIKGLASVDLAEWGQQPLHTGRAPEPRRDIVRPMTPKEAA